MPLYQIEQELTWQVCSQGLPVEIVSAGGRCRGSTELC